MVHPGSKNNSSKHPPPRRDPPTLRLIPGAGGDRAPAGAHPPDARPLHLAGLGAGRALHKNRLRHHHDGARLVPASRHRARLPGRNKGHAARVHLQGAGGAGGRQLRAGAGGAVRDRVFGGAALRDERPAEESDREAAVPAAAADRGRGGGCFAAGEAVQEAVRAH